MSDRERWIVYPLLFLAIGMSWHDKIAPNKRVLTHDLVVVNDEGQPVVRIRATPDGDGAVQVMRKDREFELTLGHENTVSSLFIETNSRNGIRRRAVLGDLSPLTPDRAFRRLLKMFDLEPSDPTAQEPRNSK